MLENPQENKFKDSQGKELTVALLWEHSSDKSNALYTLKDYHFEHDGKVIYSLERLFLEEMDITGYLFAEKYFNSFTQWNRLKSSRQNIHGKRLNETIESWYEELRIKLQALGLKGIINEAKTSDRPYQSNKYLDDAGWEAKTPAKKKKAREDLKQDKTVVADAERLGIRVVK